MPHAYVSKLAKLVKGYAATGDFTALTTQFKSVLHQALAQRAISKEQETMLLSVLTLIERWNGSARLTEDEVFRDWLLLFNNPAIPTQLSSVVLLCLPKPAKSELDWNSIIRSNVDAAFLRALLAAKLIKKSQLVAYAREKPAEFFLSAALDVAIETKVPVPRKVWEAAHAVDRPVNLRGGKELMLVAIMSDKRPDADKWILQILADEPAWSREVLEKLLSSRHIGTRFTRFLISTLSQQGAAKKNDYSKHAAVCLSLIELSRELYTAQGSATAEAILDTLALWAGGSAAVPDEVKNTLEEILRSISRGRILRHLREGEHGVTQGEGFSPFVVTGADVYDAAQEYLRTLPTGLGTDDGLGDRATRFANYEGRKEVIEGLLPALDDESPPEALKAAVEAALFNAGVQPVGTEGAELPFDSHVHQPQESGILPGEQVRIIRPGLVIGELESGLVLRKASVELARVQNR